jgi:hypothetical protein
LDTSKFPPLVQGMVKNKMALNPTLSNSFAPYSKFQPELDRASREFLSGPIGKVLPESVRQQYLQAYAAPPAAQAERNEQMAEGYRRVSLFVKEFTDAGGKVVGGSDSGGGIRTPGFAIHAEMQLLHEAGLSPMQILQAETGWAAEAWRKSAEFGTIQAGKRADVVVLNRNPLDDITATRDIHQVIQAGKVIDRATLANWKEGGPPRPEISSGPGPHLMHIPFIHNILPEFVAANAKNPPEVIIHGENYSQDSLVLFNGQLLPAKFYSETQVGVQLKPDLLKQTGTIPIAVVRPGSGGGVSNTQYLIVTP